MEKLKKKLDLSRITLGTMRFQDKGLSERQVTQLIEESWKAGIISHHSSSEYSSYELYTKALKNSSVRNKVKHVVKISSPHFEDDTFSKTILEQRIDGQLKTLQVDSIDVLQWLVRSKPIDDANRLQILRDKEAEIKEVLLSLKQQGKIKATFSFPYSVPFAEAVIKFQEVDGIISYLNKEEVDYAPFANKYPFIAIRPLFSGKLIQQTKNIDETIAEQFQFVENHPNVLTTIVGINTLEQVKTYKKLLS